jgi:hypothetical protein
MVNNDADLETIQNLQDQVLVLEAAATAATAAAAAVPTRGVPLAPPVFTLAPALANTAAAYLDLTSASGAKHVKNVTEPLTTSRASFDFAHSSDLEVFLDLVLKKSQVCGWNAIFTVTVTHQATGVITTHNLLEEQGLVSLAATLAHVGTHCNLPTKLAQDSFMLCQCLLSSLSLDFLKLITAEAMGYHLPPIVATDGPIPSGPLLLKLIISKAHVDSRATVTYIRTSLTELDDKMTDSDSKIQEFNLFVQAQVKSLAAPGESSGDLLINLFKVCEVANDSEFKDFIRRKENKYEEGHNISVNNALAKFRA